MRTSRRLGWLLVVLLLSVIAACVDLTRCLGVADMGQGLGSAVSPTYAAGCTQQVTSAVEYLPAGRAPAIERA